MAWLDLLAGHGTQDSPSSSSLLSLFHSVCWLILVSFVLEDVLRHLRILGGCWHLPGQHWRVSWTDALLMLTWVMHLDLRLLCQVCDPRVVSENWTLCPGGVNFESSLPLLACALLVSY